MRARRDTGDREELVGEFFNLPVEVKGLKWYPMEGTEYVSLVLILGQLWDIYPSALYL